MWLILLHLIGIAYLLYIFLVMHFTNYKTPGWEWFWYLPNENSDHWLSRWMARHDGLAMLLTGILVLAGVVGISRFIVWVAILIINLVK